MQHFWGEGKPKVYGLTLAIKGTSKLSGFEVFIAYWVLMPFQKGHLGVSDILRGGKNLPINLLLGCGLYIQYKTKIINSEEKIMKI